MLGAYTATTLPYRSQITGWPRHSRKLVFDVSRVPRHCTEHEYSGNLLPMGTISKLPPPRVREDLYSTQIVWRRGEKPRGTSVSYGIQRIQVLEVRAGRASQTTIKLRANVVQIDACNHRGTGDLLCSARIAE